jgi:hypothetical protein
MSESLCSNVEAHRHMDVNHRRRLPYRLSLPIGVRERVRDKV